MGSEQEIKAKFEQLRIENSKMRGMLKQNEIIISKNLEQFKYERSLNKRILEALQLHIGSALNIEEFVRGLQ